MRARADPAESRFAALFKAFAKAGITAEPAVWHDDFADEVAAQLRRLDAVLVWCNPIEAGRRRDRLDAVLREAARHGVLVSAHPDTIQRLGTKDVLFEGRDLPFGGDVCRIDSRGSCRRLRPPGHQCAASRGRATRQRLYHAPQAPQFQVLGQRLESQWITLLRERVGLAREQLPLLWDCDFMAGEPTPGDPRPFVLCEVNVSSVSPFPPSAIEPLVAAVRRRLPAGG